MKCATNVSPEKPLGLVDLRRAIERRAILIARPHRMITGDDAAIGTNERAGLSIIPDESLVRRDQRPVGAELSRCGTRVVLLADELWRGEPKIS